MLKCGIYLKLNQMLKWGPKMPDWTGLIYTLKSGDLNQMLKIGRGGGLNRVLNSGLSKILKWGLSQILKWELKRLKLCGKIKFWKVWVFEKT